MGEVELVNVVRDIAVDAVKARTKPVSVQIGRYVGKSRVSLNSSLTVDTIIPRSVTPLNEGDNVLVLKQDGSNKYFVIAVI